MSKILTKVAETLPLPKTVKETFYLRAFGFLKIPMLFMCSPTVISLDERRTEVKIPLNFRTKNHLGSMYFAVLAAGADCAGGLLAMKLITESGKNIALIFKDFHADFHKRPHSDVHFICEQGSEVKALVDEAIQTKERVNLPLHIKAYSMKESKTEPVASFILTLSLKLKE